VVRLAAKHAVSYGADDPGLRRLALEAYDLDDVYDDLVGPLEDYLNKLQWTAAEGKTPADVIADPATRMKLWQELSRQLEQHRPQRIATDEADPGKALRVLKSLLRARLEKAGFAAS
jgi:hypothetical protein